MEHHSHHGANHAATHQLHYRHHVVFLLQFITVLDGLPVSVEEKVAAINQFDPPPEVVAAAEHRQDVQRQIKQYARIKAGDLALATRFRPIVLAGPAVCLFDDADLFQTGIRKAHVDSAPSIRIPSSVWPVRQSHDKKASKRRREWRSLSLCHQVRHAANDGRGPVCGDCKFLWKLVRQ